MTKYKFIYGLIGLVFGCIIGFVVANNLNRNKSEEPKTDAPQQISSSTLPPDHPPFGQTSAQNEAAAMPQIALAIEKADKNPNDFEAQMTAGDLYYQIRRFEDAAKYYAIANKLRPEETEPIVKLGNAFFDIDNFVEAEKWYELALKKTPNDISVRTDYGLSFFLRKPSELDRAIKEFEISLKMQPNHEFTLQNLVVAYTEKGDEESLKRTSEALNKINPNNPVLKKPSKN